MKISAGILLYRYVAHELQLLLVHPGGPFWKKKDDGAWSIPKGEMNAGEDALLAALREFEEETGVALQGHFLALPPVKQNSAKTVYAFALEKDMDVSAIKSNAIEMEWPPRSGKKIAVPEVDRAAWFPEAIARKKIIPGQLKLLDALVGQL